MKLILSNHELLIRDASPAVVKRYDHPPFECVEGAYCPVCKGIGILPVRDIWPRLEALYRTLSAMTLQGSRTDDEILKSVMEVVER